VLERLGAPPARREEAHDADDDRTAREDHELDPLDHRAALPAVPSSSSSTSGGTPGHRIDLVRGAHVHRRHARHADGHERELDQ
jgi:hypothetical protein